MYMLSIPHTCEFILQIVYQFWKDNGDECSDKYKSVGFIINFE